MGFDYEIRYKSGRYNPVADALSRVPGFDVLCMAISLVSSNLTELLQASYVLDDTLKEVLNQLQQSQVVKKYSLQDGLLRKNGKLVVGPYANFKAKIITWLHSSLESGHSGRD